MVEYELEGDLLQNITFIVSMPYINGEPLEIKHYNRSYNMTIVETKYGKMIRVDLRIRKESGRMNMIRIAGFSSFEETIDVLNTNITLSPLFEREFVSRNEDEKGFSEVYRIKVPIYAEYSGNSTIKVYLYADSGFHALSFFFHLHNSMGTQI